MPFQTLQRALIARMITLITMQNDVTRVGCCCQGDLADTLKIAFIQIPSESSIILKGQ